MRGRPGSTGLGCSSTSTHAGATPISMTALVSAAVSHAEKPSSTLNNGEYSCAPPPPPGPDTSATASDMTRPVAVCQLFVQAQVGRSSMVRG